MKWKLPCDFTEQEDWGARVRVMGLSLCFASAAPAKQWPLRKPELCRLLQQEGVSRSAGAMATRTPGLAERLEVSSLTL